MTIFLAAVLGSLLSWGVHGATWWLRRRAFTAMGVMGCFVWPLGCLLCWWVISILPAAYYFKLETVQILYFVLLWSTIFFIGVLQSHWIEKSKHAHLALYAFVLELVFATYVSGVVNRFALLHSITPSIVGSLFSTSYNVMFWMTLISLAIFRPLVIRHSQGFFKLMKPETT